MHPLDVIMPTLPSQRILLLNRMATFFDRGIFLIKVIDKGD